MFDSITFVEALAIGSGASAATFGVITAAYCCYMKMKGPITDAVAVENVPVVNLEADIEKGLISKPVEIQPKIENNKTLTFAFNADKKASNDLIKKASNLKPVGCRF